ncbi:MAG: nucleotidyltransferase family protein [Sulfurimonas sp.]|uniref:nucleotidyltransferase family protein n=1 Tax=Sulfurimonas sp. TaxID=2022749 RepID=UPI00262E502A|nr:nucleotidyltransferase family protein [Sulfurimonas sp.]MDD5371913.1 nucleotidyltransferase family protein [Sulfurimonas sp.]
MTKTIILNFLREHRQELHDKFGLTKIGLFGSYVRDEQNVNSDIDIAVEIESKNKFRSFFALKQYLEENLQHKVDLGIESTLKPIVKKYIDKEIIYV